jgi:hypothetical protein
MLSQHSSCQLQSKSSLNSWERKLFGEGENLLFAHGLAVLFAGNLRQNSQYSKCKSHLIKMLLFILMILFE